METHLKTAEEILTERHGFHKSMMMKPCDLFWHAVIDAMKEVQKEVEFANQSKWVSVKTPPEEGQSVFFWRDSPRKYYAGKYSGGEFLPRQMSLFKNPVTHWMPIIPPQS